jgi:hypothetical protein
MSKQSRRSERSPAGARAGISTTRKASSHENRNSLPRHVARRLIAVAGVIAVVTLAALGGFGGGSSLAAAAEVPASCVEYQNRLERCFGGNTKIAAPHVTPGRADAAELARRCSQAIERLSTTCR